MGTPSTTAIIGLTGGIACGKSTVAARFRARGAPVIDADVLAREVVMPGEPAYHAVVRAFGPDVVRPDGELDRAALGARVFADEGLRRTLNAITHPAIAARTGKAFAAAQRAGLPWVVYEAALIIENGLHHGLSALVVVSCPPALQLERLVARSGLDEAEARRRVAAQTDDAARRAAATWVIENDADRAALESRTDAVIDAIVARYGVPREA